MAAEGRAAQLGERYPLLRSLGFSPADARKYRTSEVALQRGTGLTAAKLANIRQALTLKATPSTPTLTDKLGRIRLNPLYRDFFASAKREHITPEKAKARLDQVVDALIRNNAATPKNLKLLKEAMKTGMSGRQGEPLWKLWQSLGGDPGDLAGYGVYE